MFFYLLFNSSLIQKMRGSEREKNIRVLIVGVIAYTLLHAVMFIGGKDSLLHNLKGYFWILLTLDVITNLLTNEKLLSDIMKTFPVLGSGKDSDLDDGNDGYRLIVPSANPNELGNENRNEKNNQEPRKPRKPREPREPKKKKREVSFSNPLATENSYANDIPKRDMPTIENLLEQKLMNGQLGSSSKSTPLNQLNLGESGFSDSDSDFTTDMDGDFSNFEKGLSF